ELHARPALRLALGFLIEADVGRRAAWIAVLERPARHFQLVAFGNAPRRASEVAVSRGAALRRRLAGTGSRAAPAEDGQGQERGTLSICSHDLYPRQCRQRREDARSFPEGEAGVHEICFSPRRKRSRRTIPPLLCARRSSLRSNRRPAWHSDRA